MLERAVLGPCTGDQIDRLPELTPCTWRGDIVVEGFRPAADGKPGDQPSTGHAVQHRVFLGDAERVQMKGQDISEYDDLAVLRALGEGGRYHIRRRHEPVYILVVFVQHHAVESQFVRVDKLVDIFLVEALGLLAVPQRIRHRHPATVVFFVKVFRQIGICHEVPAEQFDRMHLRALCYVY